MTGTLKEMLSLGLIKVNSATQFQWANGLSAPFFVADKNFQSVSPAICKEIVSALYEKVKKLTEKYPDLYLASTSPAASNWAARISERFSTDDNLPLKVVNVINGEVEGSLEPGAHVLTIDDVIATGNTLRAASSALTKANAVVINCYAIFDCELEYSSNLKYDTLYKLSELFDEISVAEKEAIIKWQSAPQLWVLAE